MAHFGSIGEFRAALNGLVSVTEGRSRRNPKARRNMAARMLPSGALEFDTPEEMLAYQRAQGGHQAAPELPMPAPRAARPPRPARAAKKAWSGAMREPEGPVSYGQASIIGKSIGGLASYAPELMSREGEKGGSHQAALSAKGLTKARASAVLDVMIQEGVAKMHGGMQMTPAQQARARQILAEVGGVSVGSRAAANPWGVGYDGNRVGVARKNMAGRPGKHGLPRGPAGVPEYSVKGRKELEALAKIGDRGAAAELSRRAASKGMRADVEAPASRVAKRSAFKKGDVILAFGSGPGVILELLPRDKTGLQWYLVDFGPGGHQLAAETYLTIGPARSRVAANPTKAASRRAAARQKVPGYWTISVGTPEGNSYSYVVSAPTEEAAERQVSGDARGWDVRPASIAEVKAAQKHRGRLPELWEEVMGDTEDESMWERSR